MTLYQFKNFESRLGLELEISMKLQSVKLQSVRTFDGNNLKAWKYFLEI